MARERDQICEVCGRPAEFIVYSVSRSGRQNERGLCEACCADAERVLLGADGPPLVELFRGLVWDAPDSENGENRTKVCPSCGNTLDEVIEFGMVGCFTCYMVFRDQIDKVIRKLHGGQPS